MRKSIQLNLPACPLEKVQATPPQHTVREWVEVWRRIILRAFGSQKSAALTMGISEQQLSNKLAYDGDQRRERLSVIDMRAWGPEQWDIAFQEIARYHAATCGADLERASDAELGRAFRQVLKAQR